MFGAGGQRTTVTLQAAILPLALSDGFCLTAYAEKASSEKLWKLNLRKL